MLDHPSYLLKGDISLVLCGEAGQGIQTIEYLLTKLLKLEGYYVYATKEYMSRIRGGSNSTEIRISSKKVAAYVDKIDILIPLDREAIPHLQQRISPATIILGEQAKLNTEYPVIDLPLSKIATAIGNPIFANTVAVGVISGLFKVNQELIAGFLRNFFHSKDNEIIEKNITAAKKGYQIGLEIQTSSKIPVQPGKNSPSKNDLLLNGADAVSLGAIAGGCNFVAAYPMSPSTGVLTNLAHFAAEFGIIVEQAEDEISAINMGIGAWYAGGRALVSTAGGGFALMAEGLSLAGMIESPLVIHLAQRPGPATGLPTRTEQADLDLALYAGHGEFPRIILAPGTLEDAFYLTQKAFNLAAKYQVPVFILTDQYLMDSLYHVADLPLSELNVEAHIVETTTDYQRYQFTPNGISPRGIPGFGQGLVGVDSDEHDQAGHITEDLDLRIQMTDKRLRKMLSIEQEILPPELVGKASYVNLIIGWGSTYHTIKEALQLLGRDDIAFLYYKQVYPLHPATLDYLKRASKVVIIENNATAQFGKLIKLVSGYPIELKMLKYNGMPFSVEEMVLNIQKCFPEVE